MLAAAAYLFRVPLLRTAGSVLVADDGLAPCTRVAILTGDRRHDAAAGLVAAGRVDGVLVIQMAPSRTEELGLRERGEDLDRRELVRRGVPADRIELVPGRARTTWDKARQLGVWLGDHPDATVLVLVERFSSRHARVAFRQALPADRFARVRVAALPDREFTERDWWRPKRGGLAFGFGALDLGYAWLAGEGTRPPEPPGPDELERLP